MMRSKARSGLRLGNCGIGRKTHCAFQVEMGNGWVSGCLPEHHLQPSREQRHSREYQTRTEPRQARAMLAASQSLSLTAEEISLGGSNLLRPRPL